MFISIISCRSECVLGIMLRQACPEFKDWMHAGIGLNAHIDGLNVTMGVCPFTPGSHELALLLSLIHLLRKR